LLETTQGSLGFGSRAGLDISQGDISRALYHAVISINVELEAQRSPTDFEITLG
jgi:hypothetical protein